MVFKLIFVNVRSMLLLYSTACESIVLNNYTLADSIRINVNKTKKLLFLKFQY